MDAQLTAALAHLEEKTVLTTVKERLDAGFIGLILPPDVMHR